MLEIVTFFSHGLLAAVESTPLRGSAKRVVPSSDVEEIGEQRNSPVMSSSELTVFPVLGTFRWFFPSSVSPLQDIVLSLHTQKWHYSVSSVLCTFYFHVPFNSLHGTKEVFGLTEGTDSDEYFICFRGKLVPTKKWDSEIEKSQSRSQFASRTKKSIKCPWPNTTVGL